VAELEDKLVPNVAKLVEPRKCQKIERTT